MQAVPVKAELWTPGFTRDDPYLFYLLLLKRNIDCVLMGLISTVWLVMMKTS